MTTGRPRSSLLLIACLIAAAFSLRESNGLRAQTPTGDTEAAKATRAGDSGQGVTEEPSSIRPRTEPRPGVDLSRIVRLVLQANPMLWPLVACSIVTLGYVLERALALRRDRVIPQEFAERFLERLSTGKLDRERALELCRAT